MSVVDADALTLLRQQRDEIAKALDAMSRERDELREVVRYNEAVAKASFDRTRSVEQERDALRDALELIIAYSREGHIQRRARAALEAKP